jgi:hypothetical protein
MIIPNTGSKLRVVSDSDQVKNANLPKVGSSVFAKFCVKIFLHKKPGGSKICGSCGSGSSSGPLTLMGGPQKSSTYRDLRISDPIYFLPAYIIRKSKTAPY